jgi:hypothetical protein
MMIRDDRYKGTARDIDPDRSIATLAGIVLLKTLPKTTDIDTNDRIVTRIVGRIPAIECPADVRLLIKSGSRSEASIRNRSSFRSPEERSKAALVANCSSIFSIFVACPSPVPTDTPCTPILFQRKVVSVGQPCSNPDNGFSCPASCARIRVF